MSIAWDASKLPPGWDVSALIGTATRWLETIRNLLRTETSHLHSIAVLKRIIRSGPEGAQRVVEYANAGAWLADKALTHWQR